jgi:hypothetical protein
MLHAGAGRFDDAGQFVALDVPGARSLAWLGVGTVAVQIGAAYPRFHCPDQYLSVSRLGLGQIAYLYLVTSQNNDAFHVKILLDIREELEQDRVQQDDAMRVALLRSEIAQLAGVAAAALCRVVAYPNKEYAPVWQQDLTGFCTPAQQGQGPLFKAPAEQKAQSL